MSGTHLFFKRGQVVGPCCSAYYILLDYSRLSQPLGWWCWGPRYLVPWIPVLAFLALAAEPRLFDHIFARLARTPHALVVGGATLILISFPSAEALYSGDLGAWLFQPDFACPTDIQEHGPAAYLSPKTPRTF